MVPGNRRNVLVVYSPALAYLILSLLALLLYGQDKAVVSIADDAYYYFLIAKNISEIGQSSLLPEYPTNGYHPIWLLLLTAAGNVFGFSLITFKVLEIFAVFAGFVLFQRFSQTKSFWVSIFYTLALWYLIRTYSLNGMETTLLFPALVLFFASLLSDDYWFATNRTFKIFLASCLVIGTRLDAGFFVLPILFLSPVHLHQKAKVFAGIVVTGAFYAGLNHLVFGSALPVSGAVKSLGGLQFNDHYWRQVNGSLSWNGIVHLSPKASPWLFAALALLIALVAPRSNHNRRVVMMLIAAVVGLVVFATKLMFFSSWAIWPWYGYPAVIFALLMLWLKENTEPGRPAFVAYIFASASLSTIFLLNAFIPPTPRGFAEINKRFISENAGILAGEIVAMGDRAGSFAFNYHGGVYQVEGLVNNYEFLNFIKTDGDLRSHLCAEGIEIFVDYEPAKESYEFMDIEIFRRSSTSYPGPKIRVFKTEEIASHRDPLLFGDPNNEKIDDQIYAWKLQC